nr:serine protease [Flavipsychrobacter sp. JY13-12]
MVVLEAVEEICRVPLPMGNALDYKLGDSFFYIGLDIRASIDKTGALQANHGKILSIGNSLINNSEIPFIEFNGVGIPGYSGGPILNTSGVVIGIMREVWCYDPENLKYTQTNYRNRGHALYTIRGLIQ